MLSLKHLWDIQKACRIRIRPFLQGKQLRKKAYCQRKSDFRGPGAGVRWRRPLSWDQRDKNQELTVLLQLILGNIHWKSIGITMRLVVVAKSCLILCDPRDCSTPGFSVLQYLPEFAWVYAHWVSDAIQSCHPLLPLSPFALSLSQHQSLFQWVGSSHYMDKV